MRRRGAVETGSAAPCERRGGAAGIISLGCAKNLVDTEHLMGGLLAEGWSFVPDPGRADLLVVNTCAFIDGAVAESREAIEEALAAKRQRPGTTVVVAGCLVSRFWPKLARDYPGVDVFLKPGAIPRFPGRFGSGHKRGYHGGRRGLIPPAGAPRAVTTGAWAYLKISDGCDNRCSYCLIPEIRGPHRSRSLGPLVAEAAGLVASGVRELNLIAQDVTRWVDAGQGLTVLLESLAALPGDFRLRLLYLHPARITGELVAFLADNQRIWPYLDIPIQHASGRVLRGMNRPYGRKHLSRLYRMLRRRLPGVSLRTTVMVGFPGEGRKEFNDLVSFLRDHPFENLGAFVFSPQQGTKAASLGGRPSVECAEERLEEIMEVQAGLSAALWTSRLGQQVEALVDGPGDDGESWVGRAAWQAPEVDGELCVRGADVRAGEIVRVKITGSDPFDLKGVMC